MEGLLQGIPSTRGQLDNILIPGPGSEEHLDNIEKVLERLSNVGLRLKAEKCQSWGPFWSAWGTALTLKGSTQSTQRYQGGSNSN